MSTAHVLRGRTARRSWVVDGTFAKFTRIFLYIAEPGSVCVGPPVICVFKPRREVSVSGDSGTALVISY